MNPRRLRRLLLVIMLTLLGIGVIAVYSSTAVMANAVYGENLRFIANHLVAIVLGVGLGIGCLAIPYPALRQSAKALVLISIVLLVLVRVFGQEVNGAQRWFRIGRLSIQPSEFAKLALILYIADYLARKRELIEQFREGFLPPMLVAGLMAGLVLIQPDLGTAVAMGAVAVLMLTVAKARWRHLGGMLAICSVGLVFLIAGAEYRRRRILAFLNPWQDPRGVGFQILQSYLALAGGGLLGRGIGASMQKLFYLPSAHTDFIFAIIGEELGLFGTTAILLLYGLFISCGIRLAQFAQDAFSKYVICGCVGLIGFEAIVHMAVVTGLMPTKGLPLPLVSYGGTSMVSNLLACALVFHASRHAERAVT